MLIIWSHLSVAQSGRNRKFQAGIYSDEMVDGLKKAVDAVHNEGGKIAFQLGHGGLQASQETFVFDDPYNVDATKRIRPVVGDIPLFAVGGWRDLNQMEEAVSSGDTDFISMCRLFIKEPNLIKRFRTGKAEKSTCKSCNKCLAAVPNDLPVKYYYGGFPK